MTPQEAKEELLYMKRDVVADSRRDKALDLAIKALEQPSVTDFADKCKECGKILNDKLQTNWIPCSERLPEEETDVLICNGSGDIEVTSGSYSTELENYFMWYTSGWRFGEVIAWMPLPQPYKAESEE